MANLINKWNEYNAGAIMPPCVVQCDHDADEYLIWIWTGDKILGPISRNEYNETQIIAEMMAANQTEERIEADEWQQ